MTHRRAAVSAIRLHQQRDTMSRPPRARGCSYRGTLRVFFTAGTLQRRPVFLDHQIAVRVGEELLMACALLDVEASAFCVMPDHAHVLLEAKSERADLRGAIVRWKQQTGYWYSRMAGQRLWQPTFWDRVLRYADATEDTIHYIVNNPVRAGLVSAIDDYPYFGSSRFTRAELIGMAAKSRTR